MFRLKLAVMMAMMTEEDGMGIDVAPVENELSDGKAGREPTQAEIAMQYVRDAHTEIDAQIDQVKASIVDLRRNVKPRIAELRDTLRDLKGQKKALPKLPKERKPRKPRDPNEPPKARKKKGGKRKSRKTTSAEASE